VIALSWPASQSAPQLRRNPRELLRCRLQVVGDLLGQDVRFGEVVTVFEAFVAEPEDVEVQLVAFSQIGVAEAAPAAFRVLVGVPGNTKNRRGMPV
jgi:hypothetical protein